MASKTPRRSRKKAGRIFSGKSRPLILAAVAIIFAIGLGAGLMIGRQPAEPPRSVAQAPVAAPSSAPIPVPPPAAKPAPPAPVAEDAPPTVSEPEPGTTVEDVAPPPPPAPPKPVVAMLPPPVPPAGQPLWRRNAVPFKLPADKPAIAIVIDDMGLDRKRSARAAALPGPLTLSWLPYAHDLSAQAHAARAAGHELMLHLPMEPEGSADPGPEALKVSLGRDEILRRTRTALDSFDGYVGVNNHMGSRFTSDRAALEPVLNEIARRGLLWLDSRTTAKTVGPALAQEMKMAFVGRDVFLDNEMTLPAVRAQLARVEQVARHQGFAIAIGHPHDATIEALAGWLPDVRKRGFVLVPVSAAVRAHTAGG